MRILALVTAAVLIWPLCGMGAEISSETTECLECHASVHPGMVSHWERSRHGKVSVEEALKTPARELMSAASNPATTIPRTPTGSIVATIPKINPVIVAAPDFPTNPRAASMNIVLAGMKISAGNPGGRTGFNGIVVIINAPAIAPNTAIKIKSLVVK